MKNVKTRNQRMEVKEKGAIEMKSVYARTILHLQHGHTFSVRHVDRMHERTVVVFCFAHCTVREEMNIKTIRHL